MLLKIKFAIINAALMTSRGITAVFDLILARALPIFTFANTVAFALVCLFNMVNGAGINPHYTPVPLTIFWYGFGFSFASMLAMALVVAGGKQVNAALLRARHDVNVQIIKRMVGSEYSKNLISKDCYGVEK